MVPRHHEERHPEIPKEGRSDLVLAWATDVSQVSGRDHQLGLNLLHEGAERRSGGDVITSAARANMKVGHVEDARSHRRRRLQ